MAINRLKRLIEGDDKLELAANQILAGNSSGEASAVAAGVSNTNIAANAVTSAKIKDGEVTGPKLAALAVSVGLVAASGITAPKLAYALHRISFIESGGQSLTASITVASGAILAGALQLVSTVGTIGLPSIMVKVRTDLLANGRLVVSVFGVYTDATAIFEGVIINPA